MVCRFGESLPETPWRQAREAAQACNVFLCVGTSALVYPAAALAQFAITAGAVVVRDQPQSGGTGSREWSPCAERPARCCPS